MIEQESKPEPSQGPSLVDQAANHPRMDARLPPIEWTEAERDQLAKSDDPITTARQLLAARRQRAADLAAADQSPRTVEEASKIPAPPEPVYTEEMLSNFRENVKRDFAKMPAALRDEVLALAHELVLAGVYTFPAHRMKTVTTEPLPKPAPHELDVREHAQIASAHAALTTREMLTTNAVHDPANRGHFEKVGEQWRVHTGTIAGHPQYRWLSKQEAITAGLEPDPEAEPVEGEKGPEPSPPTDFDLGTTQPPLDR